VGFPGETDDEFQRTLDVVTRIRFDGAFMFRYSPRPGTPAAEMAQVPQETSAARLKKLIELQNSVTVERNRSQIGRRFEVLVDGVSHKDSSKLQGYTRCFRMAHFPGDAKLTGELVCVEATEAHLWGLGAKLV
jgi:tRNA-2-methylthio-N6-dimethylallyladenosine synthase